jgi:hypothetical protein
MTLTNQMRHIAIATDRVNTFVDRATLGGRNGFNLEWNIDE